jgi:hypothetical protein
LYPGLERTERMKLFTSSVVEMSTNTASAISAVTNMRRSRAALAVRGLPRCFLEPAVQVQPGILVRRVRPKTRPHSSVIPSVNTSVVESKSTCP